MIFIGTGSGVEEQKVSKVFATQQLKRQSKRFGLAELSDFVHYDVFEEDARETSSIPMRWMWAIGGHTVQRGHEHGMGIVDE